MMHHDTTGTESEKPRTALSSTAVDASSLTKNNILAKFPKLDRLVQTLAEQDCPWFGWAFVFIFTLFLLFVYRCIGLHAIITMYTSADEVTPSVVLGALMLGFVEDFVCTAYFACLLWAFDCVKPVATKCFTCHGKLMATETLGKIATFAVSWILFIAVVAPVAADVLIVRRRSMRFTFDIIVMAIKDRDNVNSFEVSNGEIVDVYANTIAVLLASTFFAVVRIRAPWADLAVWNPAQMSLAFSSVLVPYSICSTKYSLPDTSAPDEGQESRTLIKSTDVANVTKAEPDGTSPRFVTVAIDDTTESSRTDDDDTSDSSPMDNDELLQPVKHHSKRFIKCHFAVQTMVLCIGLVLFRTMAIALSQACSPLVAYSALNTTLNEMFGRTLSPTVDAMMIFLERGNLPWAETYIHRATETHELLGNDTLYRRTTGFQGKLAFDVEVDAKDPPNVLLLVIESFRHHDSHYLVGKKDPSNLFKGSNITITPSFDKWAKRGIALPNYWSSWRTSRSVESLLFGQLPYDHVTKSGMTGGQVSTNLSGLPQLFAAKGYETYFTTGCQTFYDNWNEFLPSHGFDTVWGREDIKKLAESDLGIPSSDWSGPEQRALDWGVHDDLSFQLLGDLMVNKTKSQAHRMAKGKAKKPLFLTHYTISSHVNYVQRPKWYSKAKKPDFSALYKGHEYADNIKNYLEMRYFTDMEFGKFMDRMAKTGILNDTIVVISGDHGQGPEFGNNVPEDRDVSATRVAGAIVAEGRLGKAVGMKIKDATEQYDILNTLADITGLPKGGFVQDGVGRSLKRKVKFGDRVVYSNNPTRKMSVVRGHLRLRYDKISDSMLLHNADTDHDMKKNLLSSLTKPKRDEWMHWRAAGRYLNSYYTKRWEGQCLLAAEC